VTKRRKGTNGRGITTQVQEEPLRDISNHLSLSPLNENFQLFSYDTAYSTITPHHFPSPSAANQKMTEDLTAFSDADAMFIDQVNHSPTPSSSSTADVHYEEGLLKLNNLSFSESEGDGSYTA
jgi:hypothetical protein